MSIAPIIAPLIGSWILLLGSWRAIFWLLTGFGALVGLATFWGLPETRSAETAAQARSESPLAAYRAILGERQVMAYALAAGFSHMGLLTYLAISPEVLVSGFHLSPQTYGWVIALNGAGLVTTNWINRRLLARLGYNPILRAANVGSIAASSMLLIDAATGMGGLLGITVPLFFMVGMIGFTQPNAIAGALSSDPQRAGSISALVGFFQFGGGAIGAAVAGAFHDGTPRPMAMVIFGAHVLAFFALRDIDRPKGLIAR
jgi:DHA1 family bicyclomycin/chloramphenicol resistance-like MFS transporter